MRLSPMEVLSPPEIEHIHEASIDILETTVPLAILPEPNAGLSAPHTLADLLTMNNAECLSGLAMIQLLKPRHVRHRHDLQPRTTRHGCRNRGHVPALRGRR